MLLSLAEHPLKEIYEVFAELSAQLQQKNRNPFFKLTEFTTKLESWWVILLTQLIAEREVKIVE